MKLTILILLITLCSTAFSGCPFKDIFQGKKYEKKHGEEKMEMNMEEIQSDEKPGSFGALKLGSIFLQDNDTSFTHDGDHFPCQGPLNLIERKKSIHSVGITAEVEFVSNGKHSYTGIFKGAKNGIMRFSSAKAPTKDEFLPGFTFKFFRDGVKSANIISMYNLIGQGSNSNPFAHDQTNHVPMINVNNADFAQKLLLKAFQKVSDWPTLLGSSNAAQFDQYGNEEQKLNFPYRLVFHPTKEAHESIPEDLDMSTKEPFFLSQLQGKKFDSVFTVYAQKTPESEDLEIIGEIKMNSAFKTGKYGDDNLFYQHQLMTDDFALFPEWVEPARKIVENEGKAEPHYFRPDISFE